MSTDTWHRIDAAFRAALEADGDPAEWVRQQHADDPTLRDEVLALLADDKASESAFEDLLARRDHLLGSVSQSFSDDRNRMIGARLGPFEITERIATGGMGVVYKAQRVDGQWEQTVAIKILPSWAGDEVTVQRLCRERQILSTLQHQNIPPLLDGGETEDGYPYFVIEFIDGDSIVDYVARHGLSVDKRLELFCRVADAVHYAHTKLVIHRDIKSSNVLIDRNGDPHLIDFGIAKPLDDDTGASQTVQGFTPMTLKFASPEQLAGEPVTTASDIYQLGLLLHRLISGQEFERDLHSEDTAVMIGDGSPAQDTKADGIPKVDGPLGVIVAKAMRAQPAARYASAAELAEDLRRYRRGDAILAQPESTRDVLARLTRQNPVGATALGLLAVLVVGWLISLQFYSQKLETERDFATRQAERAERVKEVLTDIYRQQDPLQVTTGADRPASMIESLDVAVATADVELAAEPDIQAELYELFSALYDSAGAPARAADMLSTASARWKAFGDEGLGEHVKAEAELGTLLLGTNRKRALVHYQRALDLIPRIEASEPEAAIAALTIIAIGFKNSANRSEAIQYFDHALSIYNKAGLNRPILRIDLLHGYGVTLVNEDRISEAEPLLREALSISESVFGKDHARVARVLDALNALERSRGNVEVAITYGRRVVSILERDHPEHYDTLLDVRNNLALALGKAHRYGEAATMLADVLRIRIANAPPEGSVNVATTAKNLATMLHLDGHYDEALVHANEAQRLMELHLPPDSAYQATPHFTKALIYIDMGRLDDGELAARRSLSMLTPLLSPDHYQIHVNRCVLGEALIRQGRLDEGLSFAQPAMDKILASETRFLRYEVRCRETLALAN